MSRQIAIFDLDTALLRTSPLPHFAAALSENDRVLGTLASSLQALYQRLDPVSGPFLMPVGIRVALRRMEGRRDVLRFGAAGMLGLTLPRFLQLRALAGEAKTGTAAKTKKAESVILVCDHDGDRFPR